MINSLDNILEKANKFLQSNFDIQVHQSQIKLYSNTQWQEFCNTNGFNINSKGLYIPQSMTAYLEETSPTLISNIFHEYFGHGLFCEQSKLGKHLSLISHNEKAVNDFLYADIDTYTQFTGLFRNNISNYEGFAVWLESLLCKELGFDDVWQEKEEQLPNESIQLLSSCKNLENTIGRFGFMSQMGFPKYYDTKLVSQTLQKMYGEKFRNIDFAILYGSKKPESDIDVFIVSSNQSKNYYYGWLDIYELERKEFLDLARKLDISVTEPLFTGEIIYGDVFAVDRIKRRIKEMPITKEAIEHNFTKSREQRSIGKSLRNQLMVNNSRKYEKTFLVNALNLRAGKKLLTLNGLNS